MPIVFSVEDCWADEEKYAPNKNGYRRIDMYFATNERSKSKIHDDWRRPDLVLAELFEDLPEIGHPVPLQADQPYYIYGIFHKSDGRSPSMIMFHRRCIELRIDGEKVTVEAEDSKLFVIDHHNGLKYELLDSFRSKVLAP